MGKYYKQGESYRPSNGTEGCAFEENFCAQCIHEKFYHTQKHGDKQCEIFNNAILFDKIEDGYPKEWQYDDNDTPLCTAFVKWDWGRDDGEGFNEPPEIIPDDPNQLCLPFALNEIEESVQEQKLEKVFS